MEDGEHTTEIDEIVGDAAAGVPPTDPPPQPATNSSNHAANNNVRRSFKYCLQNVLPAQRQSAVGLGEYTTPMQACFPSDAVSAIGSTSSIKKSLKSDDRSEQDRGTNTETGKVQLFKLLRNKQTALQKSLKHRDAAFNPLCFAYRITTVEASRLTVSKLTTKWMCALPEHGTEWPTQPVPLFRGAFHP